MPWTKKTAKGELPTPRKLYMGVELELEGAGADRNEAFDNTTQMVAWMRNNYRDWEQHYDASLAAGKEFCSQPFTWEYYKSGEMKLTEMFAYLSEKARPWSYYKQRTAGVHIHVSRSAFTPAHLSRFIEFHYTNPDLCKKIAGRSSPSMASFEWKQLFPWGVAYAFSKENTRLLAEQKLHVNNRYMAVNCLPPNTIELRYFTSTVKENRFRGYIEWVKALYDYTHSPANPLTAEVFIEFLSGQPDFANAYALTQGKLRVETAASVVHKEPISVARPPVVALRA